MLDTTNSQLTALVADLERALVAQDAEAVAELFVADGFWRDLAALTWNLKTCEGRDQIHAMAASQLPRVAPQSLTLDPAEQVTEAGGVTEGWLVLETAAGRGVATPADWMPGDPVIIPVAVSNEDARAKFGEYETVLPYLRRVRLG